MGLKEGAINQILPFCSEGIESDDVHGDLLDLATYLKIVERRRGHQPGIAKRALENRALRQHGHIAAGVAQFIANRYGPGVVDDGDLDKVEEGLEQAVISIFALSGGGGIEKWDEDEDYSLPSIVWGDDANLYVAKIPTGPNTTPGPRDPVEDADALYWYGFLQYLFIGSENIDSFLPANQLIYPTAFHAFYEKNPPARWMVRNGAKITDAQRTVPELYEALQKPENAWKCVTEEEWQEMVANFPPDAFSTIKGIGGAPYFVLDTTANTIRLPDTRGMYLEDAGFDGLEAGGQHGDVIREMEGTVNTGAGMFGAGGVFELIGRRDEATQSGSYQSDFAFRASKVIPTGNAIKPRAFGILGCVYVGEING